MQIELNTVNTTYNKKKKRQQNVSCRYQLKDIQKDDLSHFLSCFCGYPVHRNFVLRIVWLGFGKDNSIGKGFGSVEANGLNIKNILSRINIELSHEERPSSVFWIQLIPSVYPTFLSLSCCFSDIVFKCTKTSSELLQFMVL